MYSIPNFDAIELQDNDTQHRINFFGKEGMFGLEERIARVLTINHSVFQDSCGFLDDMMVLSKQGGVFKNALMQTLDTTPTTFFSEHLQDYMKNDTPTEHHIIFKNKARGGHPSNKYNLITLGYGEHGSFHQLLCQKNHYPHTQLSKFLKRESPYFENGFLDEVKAVEQHYEKIFRKNPFELYLQEVFR